MRLGLSAILGIRSQLRRLRILIGEGALAAEDRAELQRFAWEDEKRRLRWMLGLVIAVVGLTTIAIALLSVAIVVHFWDSPHRSVAAWLVASVWLVLWFVSVVGLAKFANFTAFGLGTAPDFDASKIVLKGSAAHG